MPIPTYGQLSARDIFTAARAITDSGERDAFLNTQCGQDQQLRRIVSRMLAAPHAGANPLDVFANAFAPSQTLDDTAVGEPIQIDVASHPLIGPYKLLEQIGEGGMGTVFMAVQHQPIKRKVALKIIKPGMDSRQVLARFDAERQALALMDHPHIAKVLDAGTSESGRPYFVMELVRGVRITEFCDSRKLTTRQRLELFTKVCQAVQHAHQKGIIHRDIKPSNVLVTLHDDVAVPKVIDFGIAKATGQRLTEHSVYTGFAEMVGTPLYMSPEQAEMNALDVDTRSDVYSLGVLLYELITGTTPFDRETLKGVGFDEMRRLIREQDPPRPSDRVHTLKAETLSTISMQRGVDPRTLNRILRGELDWIVMKALEKDRTRRYESVSAFVADVQRYLSDEPVQACPPTLGYRLSKYTRRNRTSVIVTAIILVTILSSSAFSTLSYSTERQARREADEQKQVALHHAATAERNAAEATRQTTEVERQRDVVRQNLYYADMRLAFADLRQGNAGRTRDNLISHYPNRGETDRRSWEWHYLLGRAVEAEQTLYGHYSEVMTVAWSPDGSCIASVSNDGSAKVWDTTNWKLLRTFSHGPTLKRGIHWSPDSRKLAWGSASDESALRIWNRDTDQITTLHGALGSVWVVAWSHNGRSVATGGLGAEPGNVRIWDIETLESVAQFTASNNVTSISWSADDKLLAVADSTNRPTIWDVASQASVSDVIMERATCAAWHPSESRIVVGNALGDCLLWDHRSRAVISRWKANRGWVTDIKWNADGSQLLSAGADGMVKVWDPVEGRELRSVAAHAGSANSVSWDPSGQKFASGGTDHVIRVWNVESRLNPLVIDTKLEGNLKLTWNNDSLLLWLAAGEAGKVVSFDATSGKELEEISLEQTATRRLVSFRHIVVRSEPTVSEPAKLLVSDVSASKAFGTAVAPNALNSVGNDAVLSPDGTRIACLSSVATAGLSLVIKDLHSERAVISMGLVVPVGIAWSPDGHLIAVVGCGDVTDNGGPGYAGWAHVFNADSGERVRKFRIGPDRVQATAVGWSHDGRRIAVGTAQGLCEVWEWESRRRIASEQIHSSKVNDLAWSPDDLRIASGGINEQVHLWDSATGQQLLALEPQDSPICHIRWSPEGHKLAAVSDNGLIHVWDASNGYELTQRDSWTHMIEPRDWKEYDRLIDEKLWPETASLLKEMIAAGNQGHLALYRLALVSLQIGDEAGYREACQRMLVSYAETEDKGAFYTTTWACALGPATLDDYEPAIILAQRAVDLGTDTRFPLILTSARCSEALGAVLFRAGRYNEAIKHLQVAYEALPNRRDSLACTSYLLAMTHQRLGRTTEARMLFERANEEADKELSDKVQPPRWDLRLTLKLFKEEAAELIGRTEKGQVK